MSSLRNKNRKRLIPPTCKVERELFSSHVTWVIGCDEVGRGALAGPVAVGAAVVEATIGRVPSGLHDSKLLLEPQREAIIPRLTSWVTTHAVGTASAAEIDQWGIIKALGLAGSRALAVLRETHDIDMNRSVVLLDGNHDYLTPALDFSLPVHTRIQADRDCAVVAAASVFAKVYRDRLMIQASDDVPHFGWKTNKGYGTPEHRAAIVAWGTHDFHRTTWLSSLNMETSAGENLLEVNPVE